MKMKKMQLFLLLLGVFFFNGISGAKILGVFPHSGKSHFDVFVVLMRELAKRGHEVTVISHFPEKNPLPNYTDISLAGTAPILVNIVDLNQITHNFYAEFLSMYFLSEMGKLNCEALGTPQIQNLVKSNQTFDLIIEEQFNTDCYLALNHIFKTPHIALSSCTIMPWSYDRFGIVQNPAFVPHSFLHYTDKMTFWQRVTNAFYIVVFNYVLHPFMMDRPANQLARKHLGEDIPDLQEIARNTSLMLVNTHFSINMPRSYPPSIIEISGLYLKKANSLPQDLEKYISESKDGVILFSFGSMVKAATFPEDKRKMFIDVFAELPQRIIWKYENETLPNKPDNVLIQSWLPQNDILAHPNVIAFISHGGLLGTTEAVQNGVPVVSIPMYGDQMANANALAETGGAVVLEFTELTKEKILNAIKTVLSPSFRERAKEISRAYNDRPQSAMETAVWWVEYIIRHKGGHFLRGAAVHMPFYQKILLDIIAFYVVLFAGLSYIFYKTIKFVRSKSKNSKKKLKQN